MVLKVQSMEPTHRYNSKIIASRSDIELVALNTTAKPDSWFIC